MYTLKAFNTSFNRPANTTPYVANRIVSNGSALFLPAPAGSQAFYLRRLSIYISQHSTNTTFRLHLFRENPGAIADQSTLAFQPFFNVYEGFLETSVIATGGLGVGTSVQTNDFVLPANNGGVWGLLETLGGYNPIASSNYRVGFYTEYSL